MYTEGEPNNRSYDKYIFSRRAILIELEAGTASIKMKAAKHTVSQEIMQGIQPGVNARYTARS